MVANTIHQLLFNGDKDYLADSLDCAKLAVAAIERGPREDNGERSDSYDAEAVPHLPRTPWSLVDSAES
jgi:hypothetical protein